MRKYSMTSGLTSVCLGIFLESLCDGLHNGGLPCACTTRDQEGWYYTEQNPNWDEIICVEPCLCLPPWTSFVIECNVNCVRQNCWHCARISSTPARNGVADLLRGLKRDNDETNQGKVSDVRRFHHWRDSRKTRRFLDISLFDYFVGGDCQSLEGKSKKRRQ